MNNKGFSLVELIVVVLIMAIIGVALAPQVIKWVNNSRVSSDNNNYDSLVSAAQLALANEDAYSAATSTTYTITMAKTGTTIKTASADVTDSTTDDFVVAFRAVAPEFKNVKKKEETKVAANYTITVSDGTVVKGTTPADSSSLD